jgi:hypothetical protein
MSPSRNSAAFEIAWRVFFVLFAIAVVLGVAAVAGDAIRLRPQEAAAMRTRSPALMLFSLLSVYLRYQRMLSSSVLVIAATLAGFWVLGGAVLRAVRRERPLLPVLLLRFAALGAGSAACTACVWLVMAVAERRFGPASSVAVVALFSVSVYGCWRWVSLLLVVTESAGSWRAGWRAFVRHGPALALEAASNSTMKWILQAAVTLPAILAAAGSPRPGSRLAIAGLWALAMAMISGYFAARLRDRLPEA